MTTRTAITGRPAWAVTAWTDDRFVYVELPCVDAAPYITKYPLTENGLGKALGLMRDAHRKKNPSGSNYTIAPHPKLRTGTVGTEAQRENARNVLKRLGIIPKR